MEKELYYQVSNKDLERKFKSQLSQIKIMIYSKLNDINNILDILPSNLCVCFILLQTSENSGHWTCLVRNDTNIYYFDSYGIKYDGELSKIAKNVQYLLHENTKALTRLITTIPSNFNFQYNKIQFQEYSPKVNTCGKWCYIFTRSIFEGLTLKQFQQKLKTMKTTYNISYDALACSLYKKI
jgi:hypothetical protein